MLHVNAGFTFHIGSGQVQDIEKGKTLNTGTQTLLPIALLPPISCWNALKLQKFLIQEQLKRSSEEEKRLLSRFIKNKKAVSAFAIVGVVALLVVAGGLYVAYQQKPN